ncbi:Os03g0159150, partial [Oryza sativa Japonica Group]
MRWQLLLLRRCRLEPGLLGVPAVEALVVLGEVLPLGVVLRQLQLLLLRRRRRVMRRPDFMAGPAREVRELGQRGELEGVIRRQGEVGAHAAVGEEHGAAVQVVEAVRRRGRGLHPRLLLRLRRRTEGGGRRRGGVARARARRRRMPPGVAGRRRGRGRGARGGGRRPRPLLPGGRRRAPARLAGRHRGGGGGGGGVLGVRRVRVLHRIRDGLGNSGNGGDWGFR